MRETNVGKVFGTNNFGDCQILEYQDAFNVIIKFMNTGYITNVQMCQIKSGEVKDRLAPTLCGVGFLGEEVTREDGADLKEYIVWQSMIRRCYDSTYHTKRPTYRGCKVSESFKSYSYFKQWCTKQAGFLFVDEKDNSFVLDKDILLKGNKIYSEDTCCFVPQEVNNLFVKSNGIRGNYPIGVYYNTEKRKFRAAITVYGKNKHIGTFNNIEDAFYAYKQAKEDYIKEVANKWKDDIDPRVYEALMNYQVEITD